MDINTVLTDLKNKSILNVPFMSTKQQQFWHNLSQKEIIQISNTVLQQKNTDLHYLDKYSIIELNYILKMFPLESINKKIKSVIDKLDLFYVYNIVDYRIYNTNLKIIKNIKKYKNLRLKQQQENKNGK